MVINERKNNISLPKVDLWSFTEEGGNVVLDIRVEVIKVVSEMHRERERREGEDAYRRKKGEVEKELKRKEERRNRERRRRAKEVSVEQLGGQLGVHFKGGEEENKAFLFGVLASKWFCGVEKGKGEGVKEVLDASFGVPPPGVMSGMGGMVKGIKGVREYEDFFRGLGCEHWVGGGGKREVARFIRGMEEVVEKGRKGEKVEGLDPCLFVWRKEMV